jgi:DNA-binding MarR family transcriptional regulator
MPALDNELVDSLFQLSFLLQGRLSRLADAHDLSLIQVRLLGILRDREPAMNELAGYLELEKSSLSGLIDRAEKRELVTRVPSPDDRRAATVRITAKGRRLSQVVAEQARREIAEILGTLSRADRERLSAILASVMSNFTLDT